MKKWWPKWDKRTKLNCIRTKVAPATATEKIRRDVERYGGDEPPPHVKKNVLEEIRKWNLVWAGKNKVASLDPDVEFLLRFPKGHTRGISTTNRYVALGNSFQVGYSQQQLSFSTTRIQKIDKLISIKMLNLL